jgi:hypothetical protein
MRAAGSQIPKTMVDPKSRIESDSLASNAKGYYVFLV